MNSIIFFFLCVLLSFNGDHQKFFFFYTSKIVEKIAEDTYYLNLQPVE